MSEREQRLQEIRERHARRTSGDGGVKVMMKDHTPQQLADFCMTTPDIKWLLAEIERLESQIERQNEQHWNSLEKIARSFRENF